MSFFTQKQLDKIVEIGFEAGKIALKYHKDKNLAISYKIDNTEVTAADFAVSEFINHQLKREFPEIIIVCEENKNRKFDEELFWLIDPIDGTNSFIKGSDEFAVNIALIQKQKPIFGLINAPAFEGGKLIVNDAQNNILLFTNNSTKIISNHKQSPENQLRIITSKRTSDADSQKFIQQFYPEFVDNVAIKKMSSSTKFITLLENKADIYLACRDTMEWDIAAGHALVKLAGGKLKNLMLENKSYKIEGEMLYKKPDFINKFFLSYIYEKRYKKR